MQLSETVADDRGISARIGKPWTTGGDVPVDRLMWQAVCVVGRRLAGNSVRSNSNSSCLPVIKFSLRKTRDPDKVKCKLVILKKYIF